MRVVNQLSSGARLPILVALLLAAGLAWLAPIGASATTSLAERIVIPGNGLAEKIVIPVGGVAVAERIVIPGNGRGERIVIPGNGRGERVVIPGNGRGAVELPQAA